jgi:hypothetical protein
MAYNKNFRNLNDMIDIVNENFKVGIMNIQSQLENLMLKFAFSNWNSNPVLPLTIRATLTEENSNNNENNDDNEYNGNRKRNDRSSNGNDDSTLMTQLVM